MEHRSYRIEQLDIVRGAAVILMIIGHSIDAVMSAEARATDLFRLYDTLRGLTAPLFLFVSGVAFTIATEKRWAEYKRLGAPLLKRGLRVLLLFTVGYALHFPFFSFEKLVLNAGPEEYARLLQVDILQCVAVGVLVLQTMSFVARTPRGFAASTLVVGSLLVLATPVVWQTDFAGHLPRWLTPYLNQQQLSLFPIFPYIAYMLIGATAGHLFCAARIGGYEERYLRGILLVGVLAVVAGVIADRLPWQIYPLHDYWRANPVIILIRTGVVLTVVYGIFKYRSPHPMISRTAASLGKNSMLIYTAHLIIVYGSPVNLGFAQIIGPTLPLHQTIALAAGVILTMVLLVESIRNLQKNYRAVLRVAQVGFVSVLLYFFMTSPY